MKEEKSIYDYKKVSKYKENIILKKKIRSKKVYKNRINKIDFVRKI